MAGTKKRRRRTKDPKARGKKEREHKRINEMFERFYRREGGSQVDENHRGDGSRDSRRPSRDS